MQIDYIIRLMSYNNSRKQGQGNYQTNRHYTSKPQYYPNTNTQYPHPQYQQGFPPPYPIYQNMPPGNNGKQIYGPPKNLPVGPTVYPQPSHAPPPNNYYYYPSYPQPYPQGYMPNYPQNYSQPSPQNYNQRNITPRLSNPQNEYIKNNQVKKQKEEKSYRKDYGNNQNYRQNTSNYYKQRSRQNPKNMDYINKSGNKKQSFEQKDVIYSPNKNSNRKSQKQDRQPSEERTPEEQNSYLSSQSESEQEIFMRRKVIFKKKDPILDSKQQIRKWIEARKRNYPKKNILPEQMEKKKEQLQLSILQKKIRKKICLINADPRSMLKKMKDIDILRRFMLYHRKNKRTITKNYYVQPKDDREKYKQEIVQIPDAQKQQQQVQQNKQIQEIELVKVIQKQSNIQFECEQVEPVDAVEIPIKNDQIIPLVDERQNSYHRREQLSVEVIIKHLQMRQQQDIKMLQNLMDYKSNSCHFRYQHQTLETNLLLDSIFKDTSYMLQSIRYIVKNNFFDQKKEEIKNTE